MREDVGSQDIERVVTAFQLNLRRHEFWKLMQVNCFLFSCLPGFLIALLAFTSESNRLHHFLPLLRVPQMATCMPIASAMAALVSIALSAASALSA